MIQQPVYVEPSTMQLLFFVPLSLSVSTKCVCEEMFFDVIFSHRHQIPAPRIINSGSRRGVFLAALSER